MHTSRDKNSYPWLPPDLAALFGPAIVAVPTIALLSYFFRAKEGDPTVFVIALVFALCGVALLFFARLPLYRQRRFFMFGPSALDHRHRRLYFCAYALIAMSAYLLAMLWLFLR